VPERGSHRIDRCWRRKTIVRNDVESTRVSQSNSSSWTTSPVATAFFRTNRVRPAVTSRLAASLLEREHSVSSDREASRASVRVAVLDDVRLHAPGLHADSEAWEGVVEHDELAPAPGGEAVDEALAEFAQRVTWVSSG
jgi:hypothetical protein